MLPILPFAVSIVAAAIWSSRSHDEGCQCGSCLPVFGFDPSGRRGPALWTNPPRISLQEEAAEGHVFSSVAPPG